MHRQISLMTSRGRSRIGKWCKVEHGQASDVVEVSENSQNDLDLEASSSSAALTSWQQDRWLCERYLAAVATTVATCLSLQLRDMWNVHPSCLKTRTIQTTHKPV